MMARLKSILEFAIREEEYFRNFYKEAAEKTEIESAKKILLNLSEQEEMHREKLETMDTASLGERVIADKISEIDVAEDLMLTPVSEFAELKDVFEFAIKAEKEAQEMYLKLSESISDENAKKLFLFLYGEEKKHETLLKDELEKIGI